MEEKIIEKYCKNCGEMLGELEIGTSNITLCEGVQYLIEDIEKRIPSVICCCKLCKKINFMRGFVQEKKVKEEE